MSINQQNLKNQQQQQQQQQLLQQRSQQLTAGQRTLIQLASGGSAGFVEVCIMQPLDVVKTRLQLNSKEHQYKGIKDCLVSMYRQEGWLSYWKGLLPPILSETPKRAIKFLIFEQAREIFMFDSPKATPLTYSLAGLSAGLTEALVINAFEVVKVQQQAERCQMQAATSSWQVTRSIIRTNGFGLSGLNKGITATLARNGLFNMVYFGFYHSVINLIRPFEDQRREFLRKLLTGFTSGTLACLLNTPFDVAKSRIQGPQPTTGLITYKGTISTLLLVYRNEGFLALYRGFGPKVMRLGPGGAIMLLVYDYASHYLQKHFIK